MRDCKKSEITIEKLLQIVHTYTVPIRINVVVGIARIEFSEAKHMHDFELTSLYMKRDCAETERLLKYYRNVPVWNLTVFVDGIYSSERGQTLYMGIQARCYYTDIREGWLSERMDIKRQKQREYRKKRLMKRKKRRI